MLGAKETRKNKTNMSLLSWNVQSIEARRVGSVTTALDVNRDLDSRFGPDEETIGPVTTKSRAAPTQYRETGSAKGETGPGFHGGTALET